MSHKTVSHSVYRKWPEDGVPQSTTSVLEVANLVQKVQMGSGNKPIHCGHVQVSTNQCHDHRCYVSLSPVCNNYVLPVKLPL